MQPIHRLMRPMVQHLVATNRLIQFFGKSILICYVVFAVACAPKAQEAANTAPMTRQAKTLSTQNSPLALQGDSSADTPNLQGSDSRFTPELLERCLFTEPCLIEELPPLGLEYEELDQIAPIMQRVWSASPWMKERFQQLLQTLPPSYLQLLRPVTAIAIAEDIRPSHYWPATGGIYIDPAFLWFTQAEKNSISETEDNRIKNLTNFVFQARWRYVGENNTNPFKYHSFLWMENRTAEQVSGPFAVMLTHELAHANDYLPPHSYELLPYESTFYDAVLYGIDTYLPQLRISTVLQERFPIDTQLIPIARSYYSNDNSSINYTAAEISNNFALDVTSSFYSYTDKQEDLAMLFEEVMMKEFFDLDRDMAFTQAPQQANVSCNDHRVHWGIRNRFAHPNVRARAEFSASQIFPNYDFTALFEEVYESSLLPTDVGWCDSISVDDHSSGDSPHSHSPTYDDLSKSYLINTPFIPQP